MDDDVVPRRLGDETDVDSKKFASLSDEDLEDALLQATPLSIDPVMWIATAVLSGVVGNLAYDVLKAGLVRFQESNDSHKFDVPLDLAAGVELPEKGPARELFEAFVNAAVVAQCEQRNLTAPPIESLTHGQWIREPYGKTHVRRTTVKG